MRKNAKFIALLLAFCFLVAMVAGCSGGKTTSDKYPSKPVTIVVPYNPGGGVDTSTRTIQPALQAALGQNIVIENRPGGGMSVGYNYVADAKPDGYTLLAAPIPTMIFTDLQMPELKARFNDFIPIASWVNEDTSPLLVNANSPYKTAKDLIDAAKVKPLRLGLSGGAYSTDHMAYALIAENTGAKFNLVPYTSSGDAIAALEGGHVDAVLASLVTAVTAQDAGRARILAVPRKERASVAPNVPTFVEQGYNVVIEFHIGLFAPPKTPDAVVKIIADKLVQAANSDEFKKRAKEVKSPVGAPMNQEQWTKYCKDEYERWKNSMSILQKHPLG